VSLGDYLDDWEVDRLEAIERAARALVAAWDDDRRHRDLDLGAEVEDLRQALATVGEPEPSAGGVTTDPR
jgi:hypothetical protein